MRLARRGSEGIGYGKGEDIGLGMGRGMGLGMGDWVGLGEEGRGSLRADAVQLAHDCMAGWVGRHGCYHKVDSEGLRHADEFHYL